jgi:L-2-hydroxyglutarate oxidase
MTAAKVAIIGGGIVGLASARAILQRHKVSVVVLEAEARLASHQTGHNSGVIHSGLYYKPGSLKARTCTAGREALVRYCRERGIVHEVCGKLVVATDASQVPMLDELERRGRANGLDGIERLDAARIREYEPHAAGVAALHVPQTGIVDFKAVAAALADDIRTGGGEIHTGARVERVVRDGRGFVIGWNGGEVRCDALVVCAGLQADRVARLCGVVPKVRIVPFRGEYYALRPERAHLVRNLIYPVPDPRFPFLGVHLTRTVTGQIEAGPNAVLAFKREGYGRNSFSMRDTVDTLSFGGFQRLARRVWRTGMREFVRSRSKRAFAGGLQRLVPEIGPADLVPHGAGVRAQAIAPDGSLVDDFLVEQVPGALLVLNAPSPAATASLQIGEMVAERVGALLA